jgi:hypothetical protein
MLGIFDINMPLLYGEGKMAFQRLQEEITKDNSDQTILAWGMTATRFQTYFKPFLTDCGPCPSITLSLM